jgi:hypothetical protein
MSWPGLLSNNEDCVLLALGMRLKTCFVRGTLVLCALVLGAHVGSAVELKRETIEAFDRYTAELETHLEPRWHGTHFLWSDDEPGGRDKLAEGSIVVRPANGNGVIAVKNGLIQDWIGAVFLPHCTLKTVLGIVQDYDHHKEIYKPQIADSKMQSHQGDDFQIYLRIVKSKFFLNLVVNSEHKVHFTMLDPQKAYSRSYSTRIAEVSEPGKKGEHELPVGDDRGLLWRLYNYWFFEERDGGVYATCQSVSLTRDIPFGMGKLLAPIIHDLPGESLELSLEQLRKASSVIALRAN